MAPYQFVQHCLAAVLLALAVPAHADTSVLRVVPQSDIVLLDPVFGTATVSNIAGAMVYESLFAWNAKLARSSVRGRRVADVHGRAALLEWAGAVIDPQSASKGPAALASAPKGPAAPTLDSYIEYLEALVRTVA